MTGREHGQDPAERWCPVCGRDKDKPYCNATTCADWKTDNGVDWYRRSEVGSGHDEQTEDAGGE